MHAWPREESNTKTAAVQNWRRCTLARLTKATLSISMIQMINFTFNCHSQAYYRTTATPTPVNTLEYLQTRHNCTICCLYLLA